MKQNIKPLNIFNYTWSAKIQQSKGRYETKAISPVDDGAETGFSHPRNAIRSLSYNKHKNQHKSIKI